MKREGLFRLSEASCMQFALKEFGIDVSTTMAGAIEQVFMDYMIKADHVKKLDDTIE